MEKIKFDGDMSYRMIFKDKYADIIISSNEIYTKEQMSEICKAHYENDLYLVSGKELEKLEIFKENLIKYLEEKKEQSHKQEIICRERRVPKLYEIGICLGEQYAYQDILERVKSGKYE